MNRDMLTSYEQNTSKLRKIFHESLKTVNLKMLEKKRIFKIGFYRIPVIQSSNNIPYLSLDMRNLFGQFCEHHENAKTIDTRTDAEKKNDRNRLQKQQRKNKDLKESSGLATLLRQYDVNGCRYTHYDDAKTIPDMELDFNELLNCTHAIRFLHEIEYQNRRKRIDILTPRKRIVTAIHQNDINPRDNGYIGLIHERVKRCKDIIIYSYPVFKNTFTDAEKEVIKNDEYIKAINEEIRSGKFVPVKLNPRFLK